MFLIHNKTFQIEEDLRIIAIRATVQKKNPYNFTVEWPDAGNSVSSEKGRGLFAVLPSQNLAYIKLLTYLSIEPGYQILEISKNDLITDKKLIDTIEIEFSRCNVLFNGGLVEFLDEIKKYTTNEEFLKIFNDLKYKLDEIEFMKVNDENRILHHLVVLKRMERYKDDEYLKKIVSSVNNKNYTNTPSVTMAKIITELCISNFLSL